MKPFGNILAYIEPADQVSSLEHAVRLASKNEARLTLMNVVKPSMALLGLTNAFDQTDRLQRVIAEDQRRRLLDLAGQHCDRSLLLDVIVIVGDQAHETVQQAVIGDHDLLFATADGFGKRFVHELPGSVSSSLLRLSPCPVWLQNPHNHNGFNRIVAAIDATADDEVNRALNLRILGLASTIARQESASLHVVSVVNAWMERPLRIKMGDSVIDGMTQRYETLVNERMDELLSKSDARHLEVQRYVIRGNADERIRQTVQDVKADLLVMGTQSRTGLPDFMLGSTAESVLAEASCSVLAIKPEGFVSPVEREMRDTTILWDLDSEYNLLGSQ
ncbi:Universal stress protein E [Stieleria maiorica]|uniref:Universal stress protein E n=1 Tax=Stieleria maiorica TaxID=2795974 RepID=A0A5B9MCB7_9BACT|nr:universal stress protein [Stieleria maiorica]QEF97856.1 Universal stress protein E [Stieleria maiorica]